VLPFEARRRLQSSVTHLPEARASGVSQGELSLKRLTPSW
jgi:hypothetical protein